MTPLERAIADKAKAERRRNIEAEGRAKVARDFREVNDGVDESVALRDARGETFDTPKERGAAPVRRLTGLEVLTRAGKVSRDGVICATDYADAYGAAHKTPSPRSCLADPVGNVASLDVARLGAAARSRLVAEKRLYAMRADLRHSPSLVGACDAVFGLGKTPREAGRNGAEASVYTALALAALDLMIAARVGSRGQAA